MNNTNSADGAGIASLIGRGAGLLPPRSGRPSIVHYQPQRIDGTERGARSWGMCRQFPAVADHLQDWPRKRAGMVTSNFLPFYLGGSLNRCRHFFNFIGQPRWQAISDRSEFHFINSVVWGAETLASEKSDYAPHSIGEARSV